MTEKKTQLREITVTTGNDPMLLLQSPQTKVSVKKEPEYAYTIKDAVGGEINIKHTDIGWWKDATLVRQLITALKRGFSQRRAAIRIGISRRQMEYFVHEHPDFCDKIEDFQEVFVINIIDKIGQAIDRGDMQTVRWAAEKKIPDEYGPKEKAPLIIIPISMREVAKGYEYEPIELKDGATGV